MNCRSFEEMQLALLCGDAPPPAALRAAVEHRARCAECCEEERWLRRLDRAFEADARRLAGDAATARRCVERVLRDRRVFFGRVAAPFGPILVAATEKGLCRIAFHGSEARLADELERHGLVCEPAPERLAPVRRALADYFRRRAKRIAVPVDLRLATPFQKKVLAATRRIPYGRVATYAELARRIGAPRARRAVGGALGRNPVPIVVPCHRVVASDGSLGGYNGGVAIKKALLGLEGAEPERPA